ncbi:FAD-dependent oxidoreductase [Streptomyces sp. OF3]|uniref:FAD-dependent oxidoreductase n=1 Tax=Streptomyces alkaliterrae TaxID=2213162 RepID=A0A7W3WJE9_9ACTN|nr:FAD-dependent oxidoreductase [Streptomyces alkaliterrae]MBB1253310.1 FAD-dependent oxidoreductase [Streptomyces alkaliterrae]
MTTATRRARTLVVVGHGMTGHRLVDGVRKRDTLGQWRVVVLAEERHPAYDRVGLSSYLAGKSRADLTLAGPEHLADPRLTLRLGCPAVAVDRARRSVRTADGDTVRYDALVLATGSRPFVPPVPGRDLDGCFVYRTLDDLDLIRGAARPGRSAVVVGGGLLGLEAAEALRLLGMRPHVVEAAPHLMPAQLDAGAAEILRRHADGLGMTPHCGTSLASVDARPDGRVGSVTLTDGTVLRARLVVFAAGIRPRDELAATLGLPLGERGGLLVDAHCRTSDERVSAVGECAAVNGRCHGLLAPGNRMADLVAERLTGGTPPPFDDTETGTTLKLLGVRVATFGSGRPAAGERVVEVAFTEGTDRYAKVFLHPDSGVLLGGILAGGTGSRATLAPLVGRPAPSDLEQLLLPEIPSDPSDPSDPSGRSRPSSGH